jgi:hypothetical protein
MSRTIWLALAPGMIVLLAGCADWAQWLRRRTYPPDFRYLSRNEVRSTMGELAYHTRELNRLMHASEDPREQRAEVVAELRAMERVAEGLNQSGWPSNHPLIDMNLPNFLRDIRFARESVEREPPNFLLAGSLTGACIYCHGGR